MDIDIDLFMRMLSIDSTSSKERGFADFLEKEFGSGKCTVSRFEVGDGTVNLLLSWGHPGIVFCSHLDTVPPYIPPVIMAGDDAASGVSGETGSISCRTDGQTADTVMLHGLDVKGPAVDDLARKLVIKGRDRREDGLGQQGDQVIRDNHQREELPFRVSAVRGKRSGEIRGLHEQAEGH